MAKYFILLLLITLFSCQKNEKNSQKTTKAKKVKVEYPKKEKTRSVKPVKEKVYNLTKPVVKYHHNGIVFSICDADTSQKLFTDTLYKDALEMLVHKKIEGYSFQKSYAQRMIPLRSFIGTLQTAYARHYPITLSPDMIWLLICQGFSNHVSVNSEALRDKIVNHQGKKEITIVKPDFVKNGYNDWSEVFPMFTDSIKKYIKKNVYQTMVSQFSTTTPDITIAYQITLMETVEKYFELTMEGCGIPFITLEGKPSDWQAIRSKVKNLRQYNLSHWVDNLIPILDQFVYASQGKIDAEFWENMIKYKIDYSDRYINGWIIKFFPYLKLYDDKLMRRKLALNPYLNGNDYQKTELLNSNFPDGIAKVDFTWTDRNNYKSKMEFQAGFVGMIQDKNTKALRPEIGWFVVDKNAPHLNFR